MPVNRISATLGEAERQAVFAAVQTIRQKLPFLIDLTTEERRTLPRIGDKGRGFVEQALQLAEQNLDILPRTFDVGEMRNDVELLSALSSVQAALSQLDELLAVYHSAAPCHTGPPATAGGAAALAAAHV